MAFYTVPADHNFAETLAIFCDDLAQTSSTPISDFKIYLPTRRSVKTVQDAFLNQSKGQSRLLPSLESIGDADLTEANFSSAFDIDIPPMITSLKRKIVLARLLENSWPSHYNYTQALSIAGDLGRLIDQIHTENLDITVLSSLIEIKELSQYWEITASFLTTLLGEVWPNYLKEIGHVDPGYHRRKRIEVLEHFYKNHEPDHPVIVAGSTGSIPATRNLIGTISQKQRGHVILPSLDMVMNDMTWYEVDPGHPQYLLKMLLQYSKAKRSDVMTLGSKTPSHSLYLASEMMRPAITTDQWKQSDKVKIQEGLNNITMVEAKDDQEEATAIALIMAETVFKDKGEKACLITPNRKLAKRVQNILRRWDIYIDDSAGYALTDTAIGRYALSMIDVLKHHTLSAVPFLALLKNPYCGDGGKAFSHSFRTFVRDMEKDMFRGVYSAITLNDLEDAESESLNAFYHYLRNCFAPLEVMAKGHHSLKDYIHAHVTVMEDLAKTSDKKGLERLWIGDDGKVMAEFLTDLLQDHISVPPMTMSDYSDLITQLMSDYTVTKAYGAHPQLSILGQIEARIIHADRLILAGLNEGIWPADQGFDTWMSSDMRLSFGLPSLDQKTSLSSHDFYSGFCAKDVFITRSMKTDGQPTLPSRWLQRLDAVIHAAEIVQDDHPRSKGKQYLSWVGQATLEEKPEPFSRPMPKPDVARRPNEFSVTEIEKWIRNPYWIYAKKILRLRKMDDVDAQISARERGTLIHNILDQFTKDYPQQKLPDNAFDHLITTGRDMFDRTLGQSDYHYLWWPRFTKTARWFIDHEKDWRNETQQVFAEVTGDMTCHINDADYIIKGKADRIEKRNGNHVSVIDYKTGVEPSTQLVNLGIASQLALESLILSDGSFDGVSINDDNIHYDLWYWIVNGTNEGGYAKIAQGTSRSKAKDTNILISEARTGLTNLLTLFSDSKTPYIASPDPSLQITKGQNDYEHLERIAEWSVAGDDYES
jgi:ATP-dependent helicase/nuclease subunit B